MNKLPFLIVSLFFFTSFFAAENNSPSSSSPLSNKEEEQNTLEEILNDPFMQEEIEDFSNLRNEQDIINLIDRASTEGMDHLFDDNDGSTILHYAAQEGYTKACTHAIKKFPELLTTKNMGKRTPLHVAIMSDNEKIVDILLAQPNVNKNSCDIHGNTPLHASVLLKLPFIAKKLIDKGVDLDAKNIYGETALHNAIGSIECNDILNTIIAKDPQNHARLNVQDNMGNSPIHIAVHSKNVEALQKLITVGAYTDSKDNLGLTPLDHARALKITIQKDNQNFFEKFDEHNNPSAEQQIDIIINKLEEQQNLNPLNTLHNYIQLIKDESVFSIPILLGACGLTAAITAFVCYCYYSIKYPTEKQDHDEEYNDQDSSDKNAAAA